jgi:hypothetical protein
MLEQVQRGGAAAVEQLDVLGLVLQRVAALQRFISASARQARWRQGALACSSGAHVAQVARSCASG